MVVFCILTVMKLLLKFLLASLKKLTNSEDFTGSTSECPVMFVIVILSSTYNNTSGASKIMGSLNSAFEKPTANHPPVILKSNTVSKSSPAYRTICRITGGF
jgi:hypothetical protein